MQALRVAVEKQQDALQRNRGLCCVETGGRSAEKQGAAAKGLGAAAEKLEAAAEDLEISVEEQEAAAEKQGDDAEKLEAVAEIRGVLWAAAEKQVAVVLRSRGMLRKTWGMLCGGTRAAAEKQVAVVLRNGGLLRKKWGLLCRDRAHNGPALRLR
eukprot:260941-Chlamydomonas_euryale.AAC.3